MEDLTGDVAWLWTHCRALGMTRTSGSKTMRDDVALYTAELHAALIELATRDQAKDAEHVRRLRELLGTATKIQKLATYLNAEFRERLIEAMREKFGIEVENDFNFIAMSLITTRVDGVDFTPEQHAWLGAYSQAGIW